MRRRILVTRSKSSEWTTQSTVPNNVVRLEHRSLPSLTLPSDSVTHSIRRQWKRLLIGGLAAVLCSISNVAAPVLMGILFEYLVLGAPLQQYIQTLTILCVSYTIEPILSQFYIRNVIAAEETVLAELRKEIFQRLLHEEVSFYDQHETTEFTNFLTVELDTLRNFVFANVSRDRGLRSILEVLGVMIVLFTLSWRLAPILAGVIFTTTISASIYKRSTKSVESNQFQILSELVSVADQAVRHIRTVRSFGGESNEMERFQSTVDRSCEQGLLFGRAKAMIEALNRGSVHLSMLVLFWYGGRLVRQGLLPYRILVTAIGYVYSLVYAIQGAMNTMVDYRKAKSALVRVQNLLSATHPITEPIRSIFVHKPVEEEMRENGKLKTRVEASTGDVVLKNICFAYPLRPTVKVLRDLNLTLKHGTRTALVGESGSGKSTVSSLLCRFYEPDSGQILLNNLPSNQFDRKDWNGGIALVSQEPILFRSTIFDNISYGRQNEATMHDVVTVSKAANAHEFIQHLPDGYHTVVGEKGVLLSGGERQRIAIARALLKDAPIILLDEATSSLDLRSEAKVQEALNRLMVGRTVMVIAHRLSTIKSADIIAVLKNGSIIERGTHEELISRDSYYAKLVHSNKL